MRGISRPAQAVLLSYEWTGNIRELDNILEQAAMVTTESFIRLEDMPSSIREQPLANVESSENLDEVVSSHIASALTQHGGNRTKTAKVLGISRRALLRKIDKYNIH